MPEPEAQPPRDQPRVLIVEDNAISQKLLIYVLQPYYAIETASGVDEALAKAMTQTYDMFVLDIDLGERRTGVEIMHALRRQPRYWNAPFVACTAYSLPGIRDRFLEAGFDAYISKPFTKQQLLDTLEAASQSTTSPEEYLSFEERIQVEPPPLPSTITQIADLMSRQQAIPDTDRLKQILENDPVTSTWVLRYVNSAYYSLRNKISDIDRAVVYMGFDPVCNLILAELLSRSRVHFEPDGQAHRVYERLLQHSLATAAFARHLAYFLDLPKPEQAFTSGLFTQLGRLALLSNNPEEYARLWIDTSPETSEEQLSPPPIGQELIHFGYDHATLGADIAVRWELPQEIVQILRHYEDLALRARPPLYLKLLAVAAGSVAAQRILDGHSDLGSPALGVLASTKAIDVEELRNHLAEKQADVYTFLDLVGLAR